MQYHFIFLHLWGFYRDVKKKWLDANEFNDNVQWLEYHYSDRLNYTVTKGQYLKYEVTKGW